ncbi:MULTISPECIES: acyl-CoA dehydrogenase family protein [unclassified Sphingobium]|uniref:acyl-CoA dehydrogenase family protein n=1 Tax=unclassified Sphingobium TaxID=2611147 RepID=UPI000D162799|nr:MULTISPECIES: acyl-CoA dehydrogenase family protein [unclassified Sphingobium]MBG6120021.1 alkylation response protein AidB-like acyl-CoA dehydrogenase [Sphingobium sp. JAI105]PSO12922.1 acyl-CoA dehydrogenase [Sphingobium sp. AEW4]TWD05778.1 hypothetical protein FB595_109138 [Sphingobium sp. AEW010]TWD23331.1 hypothetical protein FB596_109138 [Sphingobium sp. AEW013]TWD25191.1 hypothetical protein FB594_109138 [Sphingobium sp. AEW001]
MRDWNAMSDEAFRQAAIDFIEAECPPSIRYREERPPWTELDPWYQAMSRHGWLAPGWPVEHGGMGLSPSKRIIHMEEWLKQGVPRAMEQGVLLAGPALIARGTQEQRDYFLPRILSGEHLWCQGYSEPGAGSDLAGLRTEARIEGDEFVISGHKVWTSGALDANYIYVLARTDKSVPKQKGISFILVDMKQPGFTVRPIPTIDGGAEFGEVFMDEVRAPLKNLVGELNKGWGVAKGLLGFERMWAGSPHMGRTAYAYLLKIVRARGLEDDPVVLDRVAELKLELEDNSAMYEALSKEVGGGAAIGLEASVLKIASTETYARIAELTVELAEEYGGMDGEPIGGVRLLHNYLNSRPPTIYGGTVQIQRNILAKGALGLPS